MSLLALGIGQVGPPHLVPSDRPLTADLGLAEAGEQLDEAAFADLWKAGATMTLEQAVEYALGELAA